MPSNCSSMLTEEERLDVSRSFVPANYGPLPASYTDKAVCIVFLGFIMLVGSILNILVIVWIIKGQSKRRSVDGYVVSLCAADLLIVATRLPVQIDLLIKDLNFDQYESRQMAGALCKGTTYLQTAFFLISQTTLATSAIDRYVAICHPLYHYTCCKRKHLIVGFLSVAIWIIGLVVAVVDAVEVRIAHSFAKKSNYLDYGYKSEGDFISQEIRFVPDSAYYIKHKKLIPAKDETLCDLKIFSPCHSYSYDWFMILLFVLSYVIPTIVLAFCYTTIIHRLCVRKPVGDLPLVSERFATVKASTRRSAISMGAMFIAYTVLWLPHWYRKWHIVSTKYNEPHNEPQHFDRLDLAVTTISFAATLSTPIIYLCMDREFISKVKTILFKTVCSSF